MASIEFRHIEKTFPGGVRVIQDLSLSVRDGEFLVLLGPSGCGKSTLLNLLAGLDTVSGGEILIGDEKVNDWPPQRRNVAMVFQNYALYPHMTVRENLAFPLRMHRRPKAEIARRVEETAHLLGLGELLARKPKALSGGQRQRVAMGRAMVRDPAAFLMDEPLSNLDAKLRGQIRTEIAALQQRLGTTTLYVTHDQVEAMTLGQRVAVLAQGRLQQVDAPRALYDSPANRFVAEFVGSPPMNVFRTRLQLADGHPALALADGQTLPVAPPPDAAFAGLRPEAFHLAARRPELPTVTVQVAGVERLGHEQIVYFQPFVAEKQTVDTFGTARLMAARLPAEPPAASQESLRLGIETGALHWFDARGKRIAA